MHNAISLFLGDLMRLFKKILMTSLYLCLSAPVMASEFDQYLQEQKILDENFKIKDSKRLNELLAVLSAEDSRTLPLQIDQNTVIEKLSLKSDATELQGLIITPDFAQFERDLGRSEVYALIERNLTQSCHIFFEHEYQRANPYRVVLQLSSTEQQYEVELKREDCSF